MEILHRAHEYSAPPCQAGLTYISAPVQTSETINWPSTQVATSPLKHPVEGAVHEMPDLK
jgi:hypothetical protein